MVFAPDAALAALPVLVMMRAMARGNPDRCATPPRGHGPYGEEVDAELVRLRAEVDQLRTAIIDLQPARVSQS